MTFISYAQNSEDVMLWRALKHVERGFYVDVGANDPDVHSVTRAFYDRGWRGINIEPVPHWFELLQEKRKDDINLQLAAGAEKGELLLYEFPDTGLSTCVSGIAAGHETNRGYTKVDRIVSVETLTEICQRLHVAPIHFLKIDVEGAERQVLEGLDLQVIRPWIIVVESTLPLTQSESHTEWQPILEEGRYQFVYFDGLNRFYLAREHPELRPHFATPPNVFDEALPVAQASAECAAQLARARAEALERDVRMAQQQATEERQQARAAQAESALLGQRTEQLEQRTLAAEERAQQQTRRALAAENHVHALITSTTWRYTAPLRYLVDWWRGNPTPGAQPSPAAVSSASPAAAALSPRARAIHDELRTAIARHQKAPG